MVKKLQTLIIALLISTCAFAQVEQGDKGLLKVRVDLFHGGQSSFDLSDVIDASQGTLVKNVVLNKKGQLFKRKGQALFATDISNTAFTGLGAFYPDVNTSYLMVASGEQILRSVLSPASWLRVNPENNLTTGKDTEFIQANNLLFILNGSDSTANYSGSVWDPGSSDTASAPVATTGAWLRNYLFLAGDPAAVDTVRFSNNLDPATYTSTDLFRVNTGDGQKITRLEPFKLNELIVYKERSIWILDITGATPLTNWSLQAVTQSVGCIAPRSVVNIGNDHWFLSSDPIAVRSLVRSEFDKLLLNMVSTPVQDYFDGSGDTTINTTVIEKSCAILYDNKYILAIPTGVSTVNNTVLVFDAITESWYVIDGWYPAAWIKISNNLYYIDALDGRAVQCFTGTTGDMASGPIVTSASEPTVGIAWQYTSKNVDFENAENFKQLDSLDVEFGTDGAFDVTVYIEIDNGGFQNVGTIEVSSDAPTLPVNLPFTLGASGVARKTFQLQRYGEFKKIKVRFEQNVVSETCNLHSFTLLAKMKTWRRE